MVNPSIRYSDAGVDIDRAERAKSKIRALARRTFRPGVLSEIGTFGSLFALDKKRWRDPVLVASADGVGTKLKVAFAMGVHSTVGSDLVSHCVNDILTQGATPLFFLDYLAMGKVVPEVVEQILDGISRACKQADCALVGGETAEMPGFYQPGEYDLAGFIVGVVERSRILTSKQARPGDLLLALPSSGLHTNGYSLARKLLFEIAGLKIDSYVTEVNNKIGAELLKPHRCYLPALKEIVARGWVSGLCHVTGGGLTDNLPRVLGKNLCAVIELGSWPVLPVFSYLQRLGNVTQEEMLRTFNCGVGMVLIVPPTHVKLVERELKRRREKCFPIGRIKRGKTRVVYAGRLPSEEG